MNTAQPAVYFCDPCTEGDACGLHPRNLLQRIAQKRLRLQQREMEAEIIVLGQEVYKEILGYISPPLIDVRDGVTYIMELKVYIDFRNPDILSVLGHPPVHGPDGEKRDYESEIAEKIQTLRSRGMDVSKVSASRKVMVALSQANISDVAGVPIEYGAIGVKHDYMIAYEPRKP